MKIFYHADADGKCAAHLVYRYATADVSAQFVEMDYHKRFPLEDIQPGEEVWIVDFSIEPAEMEKLLEITKDVIWIDHHVSSIEKYGGDCAIKGLRSVDSSGCELAWLFILLGINGHRVHIDPDLRGECPEYVRLIGDRDTWTFAFGDTTRYLHEAFKAAGEPGPKDDWWYRASANVEAELINGQLLLDATRAQYAAIVERAAFETVWEGHRILVCNCPIYTSELFGERVDDYPLVAVYCHLGDRWKVSLYSVKMDVVQYAEKHGGGGHPRACGFITDSLPFHKKVQQ